jgi:hypothetical protein
VLLLVESVVDVKAVVVNVTDVFVVLDSTTSTISVVVAAVV